MMSWIYEFLKSLLTLRLFWSKPREISKSGCWVLYHECYMYTGNTRTKTIWEWLTHFRDEHYLVG